MKCTRVEKFLPLYVAGDLVGERRRRAVEHHLATCEKCRLAAAEYQASREMFRAATLPPDFDAAFYEEIRNSVLARIRRDRTLAPPRRFLRPTNARLAYAATLALLLLAAALSLHNYTQRAPQPDARSDMFAGANPARTATPPVAETPVPDRTHSQDRPRRQRFDVASRASVTDARQRAPRRASLMAKRNPHAPSTVATERAGANEIAGAGLTNNPANAQPEISRIEIQTSDPNIRIIWLSQVAEETTRPLQ